MAGKKKYNDMTRYYIYVFWLHGYSLTYISRVISMLSKRTITRDQVWGIVQNTPYSNRAEMPLMERQGHLDILKQNRLDNGMMTDSIFTANKIRRKQSVAV